MCMSQNVELDFIDIRVLCFSAQLLLSLIVILKPEVETFIFVRHCIYWSATTLKPPTGEVNNMILLQC